MIVSRLTANSGRTVPKAVPVIWTRRQASSGARARPLPVRDERLVKIVEVGARDGLQNVKGKILPTMLKLELIRRLLSAGVRDLEVGSFVRPDRVPQMADTPQLLEMLKAERTSWARETNANMSVLVPNMTGLNKLLEFDEAQIDKSAIVQPSSPAAEDGLLNLGEVAVFVPASDGFCRANNGTTVKSLLASLPAVVGKARNSGYKVRGYISVVMTDPFDGRVEESRVADIASNLAGMGCHEISLGDTTGEGDPRRWMDLWSAIQSNGIDMSTVAVHAHDTFSSALPSIYALLPLGLRIIDSSVAGLGGCPYSPGATGNVATEDVVRLLHSLGYTTGIDLAQLAQTGNWISEMLSIRNESNVGRAMLSRAEMAPSEQ